VHPNGAFLSWNPFLVERVEVSNSFTDVLFLQPSEDGVPNVVINRAENTFGFPSMAVGVSPSSQNQVQISSFSNLASSAFSCSANFTALSFCPGPSDA